METTRSSFAVFPDPRAATAMALLIVVFAIGWHIPLPGLDLEQLAQSYTFYSELAAWHTIFALGVMPLFTVLAHLEIVKLAVPPLARWQARSARNAAGVSIIVLVLSLMLAAGQGYGVLLALGSGGLFTATTIGPVAAALASFLGSTALIFWLAGYLRFPALGGGFWALMSVPIIMDFPNQTYAAVDLVRIGAEPGSNLVIAGLFVVISVTLATFANLALSRNGDADASERTSILLWPPYLASIVAGYVFAFVPVDMPGWPLATPSFFEIANVVLVALLVPVFVFAYALGFRRLRPDGSRGWPTTILALVAAIQVFICAGTLLLPTYSGLPFVMSAGQLLVVATVMLALRRTEAGRPGDGT